MYYNCKERLRNIGSMERNIEKKQNKQTKDTNNYSFDFEITHMISAQTALHSVQLPLLICSSHSQYPYIHIREYLDDSVDVSSRSESYNFYLIFLLLKRWTSLALQR